MKLTKSTCNIEPQVDISLATTQRRPSSGGGQIK